MHMFLFFLPFVPLHVASQHEVMRALQRGCESPRTTGAGRKIDGGSLRSQESPRH